MMLTSLPTLLSASELIAALGFITYKVHHIVILWGPSLAVLSLDDIDKGSPLVTWADLG